MKIIYTIFVCIALHAPMFAQLSDRYWFGGNNEFPGVPGQGHVRLSMPEEEIKAEAVGLAFNLESTLAVASVVEGGHLLFYSNGCAVANRDHQIMPNGSGLNPGALSEQLCGQKGYIVPQGAMALEYPGRPGHYILIHEGAEYEPVRKLKIRFLYWSEIDMALDNGKGDLVSKNNVLVEGDLGSFAAIRHGNGRDWWIVAPDFANKQWSKSILTPAGFGPVQKQAVPLPDGFFCEHQGQTAVSMDGSQIATWEDCKVSVFNFDRCSGFIDFDVKKHSPSHWFGGGGLAFSSNGQYLYATTHNVLFRMDLGASMVNLDTMRLSYDPYTQNPYEFPGNTFGRVIRLPNGEIMGNSSARAPYFHLLKNPGGDDISNIDFVPQAVMLPVTNVRTLPYFPNFRLYDLLGSACDTLGIDGATVGTGSPAKAILLLRPNPASDQVQVHIPEDLDATTLVLFDLQGRKLREMPLSSREKQVDLRVGALVNGVYVVMLKSEKGTVLCVDKLVVLH